MMRSTRVILLAGGGLLLSGCAHFPTGPSVMVLPGSTKNFQQFQMDDALCRDWALRQSGATPGEAAIEDGVSSAAIGTAVGAVAGAAIGAAAGDPALGAAAGAVSGLLLGSAAGSSRAEWAGETFQQRYDDAYVQCMYAKGNQIPLPEGALGAHPTVPPPPTGNPPPPPPGAS